MDAPLEHIRVEPVSQLEVFAWRSLCPVCGRSVICLLSGDGDFQMNMLIMADGGETGQGLTSMYATCKCGTTFQMNPPDGIDVGGARGPSLYCWPSGPTRS